MILGWVKRSSQALFYLFFNLIQCLRNMFYFFFLKISGWKVLDPYPPSPQLYTRLVMRGLNRKTSKISILSTKFQNLKNFPLSQWNIMVILKDIFVLYCNQRKYLCLMNSFLDFPQIRNEIILTNIFIIDVLNGKLFLIIERCTKKCSNLLDTHGLRH